MTKPVCTAINPAPKGKPLFPGAVSHIARPDWAHPDAETHTYVVSGGVFHDPEHPIENAFQPAEYQTCKHCKGNLS